MQYSIRPFAPTDYEALVETAAAAWPGVQWNPEDLRDSDRRRDPKMRFGRWVAEVDGRVVGAVEHTQFPARYHPQKFNLEGWVHPDFQRQGIGSALYEAVMAALQPYDPIEVETQTREDWEHAVSFLQRRGFSEVQRTQESHLDVTTFDFSRFADVEAEMERQGIRFITLAEIFGDEAWLRKLFTVVTETAEDIPATQPLTPIPFDRWREASLTRPKLLREGYFIAVDGDRVAGFSNLWGKLGDEKLETGVTGVARAYRGRHIALALKLRAIEYARKVGARRIKTYNEVNNRPMLAVNAKVGFVPQPCWVVYRKALREE